MQHQASPAVARPSCQTLERMHRIIRRQLPCAVPLLLAAFSAVAGEAAEAPAISLVLPYISAPRTDALADLARAVTSSFESRAAITSLHSAESKLAKSISSAATLSLVELGTSTARQALQDCLKGEYPGGGMGVLSLPQGRPSATTDHCRW